MKLNHRASSIFINLTTKAVSASQYIVTAYPIGAEVSAASSSTTVTVYSGHGFVANDKFIVNIDTTKYRTVSAVTSTTLTVNSAVTVAIGDILVNLGPDTGATSPSYDGSPLDIFNEPSGTAARLTNAQVTSDTNGDYSYFTYGEAHWELIRTNLGTPLYIIQGIGMGRSGEYNICDFGAAPSSSNCAIRIQAAMDAATGVAGAISGLIRIPAAVFNTGNLLCYRNLSVAGCGGSVLKAASGATTLFQYTIPSGSAVAETQLSRFVLDGNGIATTVMYIGNTEVTVTALQIKNSSTAAGSRLLVLDHTQNSIFSRLKLTTGQRGLFIANQSNNNLLDRIQIDHCDEEHLMLDGDATLVNGSFSALAQRNNQFNDLQVEQDRAGNSPSLVTNQVFIRLNLAQGTTFVATHTALPSSTGRGMLLNSSSCSGTRIYGGRFESQTGGTAIEVAAAIGTVIVSPVAVNSTAWLITNERAIVLFPTAESGNPITGWTDNGAADANKSLMLISDTSTPFDIRYLLGGTQVLSMNMSKLAFHAIAAAAQHSSTGEATGFTAGAGTTVTHLSTFTGNVGSTAYTIADVVKALKNKGLMAS